jgi:hypothetical protein
MEPETETRTTDTRTSEAEPGRLERLVSEVKGLADDVRTWIDLKIKLLEIEIEDRVRDVVNRVAATAVFVALAFLALVFVLVTAALGLGQWWDNMLLGFLAVSLTLIVLATLVHVLRPGIVRRRTGRSPEAPSTLGPAPEQPRLEAPKPEVEDG